MTDEFEFNASNGSNYNVSVELSNNGEIEGFTIMDETGEVISEEDDMFDEIKEEVDNREYDLEVHSANFDFYDQQLDHFGDGKVTLSEI